MQVSYHTHIPEYIPKYTWKGLVGPMWRVIRFNILMADLTLVPSKTMKVRIWECMTPGLEQTLSMMHLYCASAGEGKLREEGGVPKDSFGMTN